MIMVVSFNILFVTFIWGSLDGYKVKYEERGNAHQTNDVLTALHFIFSFLYNKCTKFTLTL